VYCIRRHTGDHFYGLNTTNTWLKPLSTFSINWTFAHLWTSLFVQTATVSFHICFYYKAYTVC